MRIVDMMSEDLVVAELESRTRDDVLRELVAHIAQQVPEVDAELAHRYLVERERIASTGVTTGIAIPHARLERLDRPIASFARSRPGVEFGALDGKPTHLFMTLLAPEGRAGLHLKALARASRMFKDPDLRAALLAADDRAALWDVIRTKDLALTQ